MLDSRDVVFFLSIIGFSVHPTCPARASGGLTKKSRCKRNLETVRSTIGVAAMALISSASTSSLPRRGSVWIDQ